MEYREASGWLKEADALLICAGAGMGVDSGLPDFRGDEGFWRAYPQARRLGMNFVDLANPARFEENPSLAWAFYGHRLQLYRQTRPHRGFSILLKLAMEMDDYFVFTSNVDGQFQKAGFPDERIYECHGSIHYLQCTSCEREIWSAEGLEIDIDFEAFRALNPPLCPDCHAVARPNILMFSDWGYRSERSDMGRRAFEEFLGRISQRGRTLAIVEIGAGSAVPTVRMTSESIARSMNAKVLRINPREPHIDPSLGWGLPVGGLEGIESLVKMAEKL
jgi:NAD-dependent SIR2 family protein deacetylase